MPRHPTSPSERASRLLALGILALTACAPPDPGPPALDAGGQDAGGQDAALDLAPGGADAYTLPPRPAAQRCRPAPVDLERLPPLRATPLLSDPRLGDVIAAHQPSVEARLWLGTADGRILLATASGPSVTLTEVADLRRSLGAQRLLDLALAPDFATSGRLYSLTVGHGRLRITAHQVASGTTWLAPGADTERGEGPAPDPPGGRLSVAPDGTLYAALPGAGERPPGLWRVPAEGPPEPIEGPWHDPSGCAVDVAAGGLWCLDHGPEGDRLLRAEGDQARILSTWPTAPECRRRLGPLYRGGEAPGLWGALLSLDPCTGRIHLSRQTAAGEILDAPAWEGPALGLAAGFAQRPLALTRDGLVRLREAEPDPALGWPPRLSQTACFNDLSRLSPGPELIPYTLNAPLWTDGAHKRRFLVLPPGAALSVEADGRLAFPEGSQIFKDFAFPGPDGLRSVETRIMSRHRFGWSFHSYRWDPDGQEAWLLDGAEATWRSLELPEGPLNYLFPSQANCLTCHAPLGPAVIGPTLAQLTAPGGAPGQLGAWRAAGLLPPGSPVAPLPDPEDPAAPRAARIRAYLHAQCAHCHRPGGWTPPDLGLDLRFETPLAAAGVCDVPRRYSAFGVPGEQRIAAGDPGDSNLYQRMIHRGFGQMPPLGTERVDPLIEALFVPWIQDLRCP